MAGKSGAIVPLWLKQAEEQKVKEEQEKAAAAKAAFEATFKDAEKGSHFSGNGDAEGAESPSESESEGEKTVGKPIGPVDPSKCTATGAGVGGGAAGAAISFVVIARDSDRRKLPSGGALIRAKISSIGSGGSSSSDQEALIKDNADGTYTVTYVVAKRGDYMVSVTCNGCPIDGSPFPVFFGGGGSGSGIGGNSNALNTGLLPSPNPLLASAPLTNGVNQSSSVQIAPGLPPGFLGMIPGMLPGATGGVILPGRAAAFGEVCRDYLNGCCGKTDCKFNHPPQAQLMGALASGTAMAGLSNMPMAPSAAAMAAAQSIIAAQAYQAKIAAQQHDKPGQQPPPLPMMMQQAIAAQQLQFQQALLMQQAFASQQAAVRTATIKSAAEMAAARAAEISKSLKADGDDNDGKETAEKSKSPLRSHARSKSRSPIKYRSDRHSRSMSRSPVRYHRSQRVRSISRDRYRRRSPPFRDSYSRHSSSHHYSRHGREREKAREYDHHRPKRSRSRSRSRGRKRSRSVSPRHRRDRSRSPRGGRREEKRSERHSRHSRSNSREPKRSAVSTTKSSDGSKGGSSRKESKTYHGDVKHSDRSHNDQGYNVEGGSEASKAPSNHRHVGKRSGEKQYSHQIITKIKELAEDPEIVSPGVNLKEQVDHTGRKQNEGDQEGEDIRELDDWRNDLNVQEENSRSRDKNRDKRKDRTRATEKTSKERDHKDYDRNTEKTSRDRDNKDYDKYKESLEQAA